MRPLGRSRHLILRQAQDEDPKSPLLGRYLWSFFAGFFAFFIQGGPSLAIFL